MCENAAKDYRYLTESNRVYRTLSDSKKGFGSMEKSLQHLNRRDKLEVWSKRVSDCRSSGMTIQQWCEENGVNSKTYYYWQRKLFELTVEQSNPVFVEMPVQSSSMAAATIRSGELSVEIHHGADSELICAIVRALKEC